MFKDAIKAFFFSVAMVVTLDLSHAPQRDVNHKASLTRSRYVQ